MGLLSAEVTRDGAYPTLMVEGGRCENNRIQRTGGQGETPIWVSIRGRG